MTHELIIKMIASEHFKVAEDKVTIEKRFSGGMSNFTYLITVNQKKYTFRIPSNRSAEVINRANELANYETIADASFLPKLIYFNVENGYKISEFNEGVDLRDITIDYEAVASTLQTLHQYPKKFDNDYDAIQRLLKYEKMCSQENQEYFLLKNR